MDMKSLLYTYVCGGSGGSGSGCVYGIYVHVDGCVIYY